MIDPTTVTQYGLIVLVINGGALWIREFRKYKANGKDLKEIKDKLETVAKKIGETKIVVDKQEKQCTRTVSRFDKAISEQNEHIIELSGRKR